MPGFLGGLFRGDIRDATDLWNNNGDNEKCVRKFDYLVAMRSINGYKNQLCTVSSKVKTL